MLKFKSIYNAIRYAHAEGFIIGHLKCGVCDSEWDSVARPEEDVNQLKCPVCGGKVSSFKELTLDK